MHIDRKAIPVINRKSYNVQIEEVVSIALFLSHFVRFRGTKQNQNRPMETTFEPWA